MEKLMSVVVVLSVVAAVLLQCTAAQTVHVVGDSIGWTIPAIPEGGTQAYQTWAATFKFITNTHDVLEVPKKSYDACSSASPIGTSITTGGANVTLDAAGDHYYICTFGKHCEFGQKLAITVLGSPGTTTPTTTSPALSPKADGPTTPASQPPPKSSSSVVFASFFVSLLSIAMAFLL
uniref:Phytocyanin domain-containing protein n=1 Tax=Fagus sylvatica TaxID=28930 RepID=A0A2N9IT38_FAGSY